MIALLVFFSEAAVPSFPLYYVGNRVWNDLNRNGIQDANEPGLNDVMVKAYRSSDHTFLASQLTHNDGNNDGAYAFALSGTASVYLVFELPRGFVFTSQNQGADDALDSDVDPFTGLTDPIRPDPTKPPGQFHAQWDAGLLNKLYEKASDSR